MPTITTGISKLLDFELKSEKAVANGYCDLDGNIKVPLARLYTGGGAGLDADTVDLKHAADFLLLAGGTMVGNIDFSGAQLHMNDNYISCGYQTGIQAIGAGVPRDLTFYDSAYPSGKTLTDLVSGSGADHGALLGLGDDDHLQYLPLTAGSRKLTGDLYINKTTPFIYIQEGGIGQAQLGSAAGNVQLICQSGYLIIQTGAALKPIYLNTASTIRLTITDTEITSTVHFKPSLTTLNLGDSTNYWNTLFAAYVGLKSTTYFTFSTDDRILAYTLGNLKLTITNTGITAAVPLAMGSNKITGLAAGSVAGDALRYEQLIGVYLPLTAGSTNALTGDLYINKTSPGLFFQEGGIAKGYLQYGGNNLNLVNYAGSPIEIYTTNTLRLTIADTEITSTVHFKPSLTTLNLGDSTNYWNTLFAAYVGLKSTTYFTFSTDDRILAYTLGNLKLTITNTGITAAVPLAMGSNKITGLAAGSVAGDALRYEQLIGVYLPLTAGSTNALTGDLYINKTTPTLFLQEGGVTKAYFRYSGNQLQLVHPLGSPILIYTTNTLRLTIADTEITSTVHFKPSLTTLNLGDSTNYWNTLFAAYVGLKSTTYFTFSTDDRILAYTLGNLKLTITNTGITAAVPLAMGSNKITGLAAATAAGDAVRYEQIVTYSMEVCDNNVGINPADASTYYFGHIGVAASTTANAQSHLRMIPRAGNITAAMIMMYATTAGTNEGIQVFIRLNNATDYPVATVGTSALVRSFSNVALNIAVVAGDNIEIKIINPTWVTNPLVVTWDGTLIITS